MTEAHPPERPTEARPTEARPPERPTEAGPTEARPTERPTEARPTDARPPERPTRVLFLCTGNSARSILAEALLRRIGGSAFEVHSAGTRPRGLDPLTLRVLSEAGIAVEGLRSKSVTDYLEQPFDYVVTLCDEAREACPVFPGRHVVLHWGQPDPAAAVGDEEERLAAFRRARDAIRARVESFVAGVERGG
ncbi:MAG TPA: hypothetical protein VNJ28_03180, partial [Candidatus Limnocylindrales bacterium]|nr:hypothetical protein [Candidatus Limnocylindrales bacterium]